MTMITFDEKKALVNPGNNARFSRVFKKLEEGKNVTIGFLGGSITQGSLSSEPETCYAYRVYDWLRNRFKESRITYVNAGVGGTTSVFGSARADADVLSHDPDIVFVEFSVNDECNEYFYESYEGLIRKLLYSEKKPAVAAIFNFYYENGKSAQRLHSKVARYYDIPAVSVLDAIYKDILSGKIEDIKLLSPDGLHPNDTGHELLGRIVIELINVLYERYRSGDIRSETAEKKEPLTQNAFESALRLDNRNYRAHLEGFTEDKSLQLCVSDCFKNGWLGSKQNDRIVFDLSGEYECTGIAIQYSKTIKRPAPVISVTVDADTEKKTVIDAAFEETWGDLLDIRQLILHEEKAPHKLEIEVIDDKDGRAVKFNLVSVIITR
ncbi:MAG: SGNH/GDSL hydrolase family protein [Lachnospiraceae bacterium]|nr:SGNH/GDSL hydrolase family protein [Lachnospiraceae bacterium]